MQGGGKMERNTLSYKSKQFLMFAGPALILFCMVIIIPFLYGLYLTFTSWDGVEIICFLIDIISEHSVHFIAI